MSTSYILPHIITMSLLDLPNELLLIVAKHLRPRYLNFLIQTSRFFFQCLTPLLHTLAAQDVVIHSPTQELSFRMPALIWAVFKGHEPLCRLLLEKGADVGTRCNYRRSWTPLIYAAHNGRKDIVRLLLQNGADVNELDETGATALMRAVTSRSLEVSRFLLENGADPNIQSKSGGPGCALHIAASLEPQHLAMAFLQLLSENGADLRHRDRYQKTALEIYGSRLPPIRRRFFFLLVRGSED